jgi:hypothetical protein
MPAACNFGLGCRGVERGLGAMSAAKQPADPDAGGLYSIISKQIGLDVAPIRMRLTG